MMQIGILVMSAGLIAGGVIALLGKEKPGKETSPGVAIAMIVLGVLLLGFAFIALPLLVQI
ncbi:hypothetical protein OT109_19540 [Phycisphaeraceae bacterium D3-23]